MPYKTETSDFKGHPTISITTEDGEKRVVSFGLKKAAAILECQEDIRKFVEANTPATDETEE